MSGRIVAGKIIGSKFIGFTARGRIPDYEIIVIGSSGRQARVSMVESCCILE